jgi:hypothetical protein
MKITKNIISREEAQKLCPEYVSFVDGNWDSFDIVSEKFETLRKGQKCVSVVKDGENITFVMVKVTSINHDDYRGVDGPVVRVSNGEYSWRCDGDGYSWPI